MDVLVGGGGSVQAGICENEKKALPYGLHSAALLTIRGGGSQVFPR